MTEIKEARERAIGPAFEAFQRWPGDEGRQLESGIEAWLRAMQDQGFKMVPREMTDEMYAAGVACIEAFRPADVTWQAMYDAAPTRIEDE